MILLVLDDMAINRKEDKLFIHAVQILPKIDIHRYKATLEAA